jgi:hypothetical protein
MIILFEGLYYMNEREVEKTEQHVAPAKQSVIKIVFVISNPDVDVNRMAIWEVVECITGDSLLMARPINKEISVDPLCVKVYMVDQIECNYLKKKFADRLPGELVYEYNNRVLIKLNDGIIKVYHNHEGE